ncbi:MAG: hypothetical protein E7231_11285 [Cellulosilyticum sp.]|nr:hypothetical protein [Cellulosilyticum sp.]
MGQVKRYGLSRRSYICIRDEHRRSYGGNQTWFPKEGTIEEHFTHEYGCGVIAITDLFLYWAMTRPNGGNTLAAGSIEAYNKISKEKYMSLVEEIRKRYAFIFASAGTFGLQLERAINSYAKDNNINCRAKLEMDLNDLTMLKRIQQSLDNNHPVILMVGHSFPLILSRLRKKGIPFYKQTRIFGTSIKNKDKPYACYEIAKKNIFGHFVTITGMIIDAQSERANEHIMLRIASWGSEYYISYHHLRQYINQMSMPYLTAVITIEDKDEG